MILSPVRHPEGRFLSDGLKQSIMRISLLTWTNFSFSWILLMTSTHFWLSTTLVWGLRWIVMHQFQEERSPFTLQLMVQPSYCSQGKKHPTSGDGGNVRDSWLTSWSCVMERKSCATRSTLLGRLPSILKLPKIPIGCFSSALKSSPCFQTLESMWQLWRASKFGLSFPYADEACHLSEENDFL